MEGQGEAQVKAPSSMKRSATSFFVAKSAKSEEGRFSAETASGLKAAFKLFDSDGDVRSCPRWQRCVGIPFSDPVVPPSRAALAGRHHARGVSRCADA